MITQVVESQIYIVKAKRSFAVLRIEEGKFTVLECSNREKCESMNIINCPPFCDKVSVLKNYLRFGSCKNGYVIESLK